MSKLVDNLLGKLGQLKRKVMTDTETKNGKPIESSGNIEQKEMIVDDRGDNPTVGPKKNQRKQGRPRRKNSKAKTKETGVSALKETVQKPKKPQKKSLL